MQVMNDIESVVRDFVVKNYLQGELPENLRDDTPLVTSGILDSLAILGLIGFLEERFSIELDVYDTSIERFDRIAEIAATIRARQEVPVRKVASR